LIALEISARVTIAARRAFRFRRCAQCPHRDTRGDRHAMFSTDFVGKLVDILRMRGLTH
jgi:hypothetical protein